MGFWWWLKPQKPDWVILGWTFFAAGGKRIATPLILCQELQTKPSHAYFPTYAQKALLKKGLKPFYTEQNTFNIRAEIVQ